MNMQPALALYLEECHQRLQQAEPLPWHHEASAIHGMQWMHVTLTA